MRVEERIGKIERQLEEWGPPIGLRDELSAIESRLTEAVRSIGERLGRLEREVATLRTQYREIEEAL